MFVFSGPVAGIARDEDDFFIGGKHGGCDGQKTEQGEEQFFHILFTFAGTFGQPLFGKECWLSPEDCVPFAPIGNPVGIYKVKGTFQQRVGCFI